MFPQAFCRSVGDPGGSGVVMAAQNESKAALSLPAASLVVCLFVVETESRAGGRIAVMAWAAGLAAKAHQQTPAEDDSFEIAESFQLKHEHDSQEEEVKTLETKELKTGHSFQSFENRKNQLAMKSLSKVVVARLARSILDNHFLCASLRGRRPSWAPAVAAVDRQHSQPQLRLEWNQPRAPMAPVLGLCRGESEFCRENV